MPLVIVCITIVCSQCKESSHGRFGPVSLTVKSWTDDASHWPPMKFPHADL